MVEQEDVAVLLMEEDDLEGAPRGKGRGERVGEGKREGRGGVRRRRRKSR